MSAVGAAEEATSFFGETAALCIQKHYVNHALASQSLQISNEDRNLPSGRNNSLEDVCPRQSKHVQGNNLRDIPPVATLGGSNNQPCNGGPQNLPFCNTPSPVAVQVWDYELHQIVGWWI